MFFESFDPIVRIVAVGVPAYVGLVLLLRIFGKRTLSQMNAFDFIVTIALGSTLASILLSKDVTLAEGLTALGLLIVLQFAITWTTVRLPSIQRVIKATPRLLAFRGELITDALRSERLTEAEVEAALRENGVAGVESIWAVVLETDGSLTVMPRRDGDEDYHTLRFVKGKPEGA